MLFRLHSRHKEISDATSLAEVSLRHYPPGVLPLYPPTPHIQSVWPSTVLQSGLRRSTIRFSELKIGHFPCPPRANNALVTENKPTWQVFFCLVLSYADTLQSKDTMFIRVFHDWDQHHSAKRSHHLCHFVQHIYTLFRIRGSAVGTADKLRGYVAHWHVANKLRGYVAH
jgi:hypothetical protein